MIEKDNEETKDRLEQTFDMMGFDYKSYANDLQENFSAQEIAKAVGLLSLYDNLLKRAERMHRLLCEEYSENSVQHQALKEWNSDLVAMHEAIKALHNHESIN